MMDAEQKKERIAAMSRTVLSYCRARTANMEEAQDLSQDILAEMLRSAADLRSDDAFYGFMWRVAGNVYRTYLRKRARETLSLREEALEDVPDMPEEDASGELCLLRRELGLLEEKYRRAMVLYYLDGLRCAEIAVRLSISESMVKYLLFAARKIVKDGMHMERNYGQLSYNPRALTPMYSGEGPNRFWDFMQSRIRQNIFCACWSDTPTQQEISLEIGIPLPYLEQDIDAMTHYGILERQGSRYRAGIGLVSADCIREIRLGWEQEVGALADRIEEFGAENAVGGSASRRWTLWTMLYRCMMRLEGGVHGDAPEAPITGWGERAWLYLQEEAGLPEPLFAYCGVSSRRGDTVLFLDYLPAPHGSHRDFFGNARRVDVYCGIARGDTASFGESDWALAGELVREGYLLRQGEALYPAMPVFTARKYAESLRPVREFVSRSAEELLTRIASRGAELLRQHFPAHLRESCPVIASMLCRGAVVSDTARALLERSWLTPPSRGAEMPTDFIILNNN